MRSNLVFALELVLHETEAAQLPAELESGQDRILTGQGD
jgi:hypothetical protein